MVELITVVPPIVVGIAIAGWAGVVVRRAVARTNGGATSE
jgi:hypothetical protein